MGKRLFDLVDKAEEVFRLIQERGQYEVGVLSVRADAMCELAGRQLREIEYFAEMLHESERESGLVQSETASLVSRLHTLSEKCNELRVAEANATTSLARIIEQIEAKKFTWSRITNPFITRIESLRVAMHQFWMEIIKRWTTR